MNKVSLLDCTLRDGGYLNDWKFGKNTIVNIFERLVAARVDFIELGFINQNREYDPDRSIFPDVKSMTRTYGDLYRGDSMTVGMIDFGTLDISRVCPQSESCIDAIRVIFKKHKRKEAMEYVRQIKALGYKVFAQLVSITSYEDEELYDLIDMANDIMPFAVSMVDTYGLCHSDTLMHYAGVLDSRLDPSIELGYHSHNNFQLGYANCIELLLMQTERPVLVDGTIYGMGKSAGNCPLELLAMYLNERRGKNYSVSQILEACDSQIINFQKETPWGYSMFYFIAASNDCHPNYVSYLMKKRTLSVMQVNKILARIPLEKKLMYDESVIEKLYSDYQEIEVDDSADLERLKKETAGRKLLVLGPGTSVTSEADKVNDFVEQNAPLVISINYIPSMIKPDICFVTNKKRFVQLSSVIARNAAGIKVMATSNVTSSTYTFDYTIKYSSLLDYNAQIIDNSFLMLLKVLKKIGAEEVFVAGFDGYATDDRPNYINPDMEYQFTSAEASELNKYVIGELEKLSGEFKVNFLTSSYYNTKET